MQPARALDSEQVGEENVTVDKTRPGVQARAFLGLSSITAILVSSSGSMGNRFNEQFHSGHATD